MAFDDGNGADGGDGIPPTGDDSSELERSRMTLARPTLAVAALAAAAVACAASLQLLRSAESSEEPYRGTWCIAFVVDSRYTTC